MDRTCLLSPPSHSRQNMEQTASAPLEGGVGVATPIVAPPAPCSTEVVAEHHGEPIVMAHIIPSSGGNGQGEGINRPNNSPTMYHQNPHANLTNKDRFDLIEEGKIKWVTNQKIFVSFIILWFNLLSEKRTQNSIIIGFIMPIQKENCWWDICLGNWHFRRRNQKNAASPHILQKHEFRSTSGGRRESY